MSSAQFFAFVEGSLDRPFFDRLASQACSARGLRHQVIAMREVPGSAGGKIALLMLFRAFRAGGHLLQTAFGKRMVCAFFADKDCDDFCRRQLRSPHLLYTETYDLEAHLFSCADLHRALADACGMTLQQARQVIPDQRAWLSGVAANWKAWTALCLISQLKHVNCGCTFERLSAVNPRPFHPPDNAAVEAFKYQLSTALALSRVDFDKLFATAERRIDAALNNGEPMKYFKGKWLLHLLQKHLEMVPKPPDTAANSAGDKVAAALVAQVAANPSCTCCAPFTTAVQSLVAQI